MEYRLLSRYRSELMGVAILWVMLFHATDLDFGSPVFHLFRSAGFGGVDIFMVLSAMGLVVSLSRREQSYEDFMGRRVKRILPAYFLVMLPYTLFLFVRGEAKLTTFVMNSLFLNYWTRVPGGFNWYVSAILLFYAFTPFLFRFLKQSAHRVAFVAGVSALDLLLCQILLHEGYWFYTDLFFRVPVFLLGLLMGFFLVENRPFERKDKLFWLVWSVLGVCYLAVSLSVDQDVTHLPMAHLFLFITVPLCLVLGVLFDRLPLGGLRKLLRALGSASLEIYLLNVSFFSQIEWMEGKLGLAHGNQIFYLLLIGVNLVLGLLLHRLLDRKNPNTPRPA